MIDKFKIGYYYRYVGTGRECEFWNSCCMDFVLDRKKHLCTNIALGKGVSYFNNKRAAFDFRDNNYIYVWDSVQNFEECGMCDTLTLFIIGAKLKR